MIPTEVWQTTCELVRDKMAAYISRSVTPIALSESMSDGRAWGTGTYVQLYGIRYLLTNEHVIRDAVGFILSHFPGSTENYVRFDRAILTDPWPIDIALTAIELGDGEFEQRPVLSSSFDRNYSPYPHELLFWLGFPGSKATRLGAITDNNIHRTRFSGPLEPPGFPCLVQQASSVPPSLPNFNADIHIALHYPALAHRRSGEPFVDTVNPKGMSGSLLWDTKFVARTSSGRSWSPTDARVCGVLWAAHDKPEVVVATKIEHIRPSLQHLLREECAFYSWSNRGRPQGEDLIDWQYAETLIDQLED